jgi:hypothetical protein
MHWNVKLCKTQQQEGKSIYKLTHLSGTSIAYPLDDNLLPSHRTPMHRASKRRFAQLSDNLATINGSDGVKADGCANTKGAMQLRF